MLFVEAKNQKELRKQINTAKYAIIKKVTGGYMCFEYMTEYVTWKNQK